MAISNLIGRNVAKAVNWTKSKTAPTPPKSATMQKLAAVKPTTTSSAATAYRPPVQAPAPAQTNLQTAINSVGQYLSPTKPFTEVQPWETYSAPQMEAYKLWAEQTFKPEFERFTYNPWSQQMANNMAMSGGGELGSARDTYSRMKDRLMQQQYYDPLEGAKSAYEDQIRQGWLRRMQEYYANPGAFTNI